MIVDKYCDKAEDGVELLKTTGQTRRQPGFDNSQAGIRLGSVLSKASRMSDGETEEKI